MTQGTRRSAEDSITHSELTELLAYDPETGVFTWLKTPVARVSRIKVGDEAGVIADGYRAIGIKGKRYQAHQLAWFYVHKVWAEGLLDHEDRNGLNNRIKNLRPASKRTNAYNRSKDSFRKLPKWVYPNHSKFMARVSTLDKKSKYLGTFETPELAYEAAKKYAKEHHGEFYCE